MSTQAFKSSYYSTFAKHDFTEIDENVDNAAKKAVFVYDKIFSNPKANCISDSDNMKPSESIEDKSISSLIDIENLVSIFNSMSEILDCLVPSEKHGSEGYRQMRKLYDTLQSIFIKKTFHPKTESSVEVFRYDYTEYVDVIYEPLMKFITSVLSYIKRFNLFIYELDKPVEAYKSVFLRDISEEELWKTRCKAYTYRI